MAKRRIIDVKGAILTIKQKKGIKLTITQVCDDFKMSNTTVTNWGDLAPIPVQFIHDFIEKYGIEYSDLVKEIESNH